MTLTIGLPYFVAAGFIFLIAASAILSHLGDPEKGFREWCYVMSMLIGIIGLVGTVIILCELSLNIIKP